MNQRTYFLPIFLIGLCFIFLILFLSQVGVLGFFTNTTQGIFFPFSQMFQSAVVSSVKETSLQKENALLRQQVVTKDTLAADNKALRDQFETASIPSNTLLPARVVGTDAVIPNVSFPENLTIHAGKAQGIHIGSVVVYKNQFIGQVVTSEQNYAAATLVTSKKSSFSIKDSSTGAIGIAKGQGNGELLVDNVLLSDTLTVGDSIVTLGSQTEGGKGIPPDILVGKIISVEKNPSSLFQKARVAVTVNLDRLTTIFVMK